MHPAHFRTRAKLFHLSALILWTRVLMSCVLAGLVVYMAFQYDWTHALPALFLAISLIVLGLVQWGIGRQTNCPLCMVPIFSSIQCSRHSRARRLFGSARLMASSGILLTGRLRCPFCNGHTSLNTRRR